MSKQIIVKWNTLGGNHYEGTLTEVDNGTGIVKLKNGKTMAMSLERLVTDDGRVIIDNQTTFIEEQ